MVTRKKKVFQPHTQMRYLVGEVDSVSNIWDLYTYNMHRFKIFTSKPTIKTNGPVKPADMMPYRQYYKDQQKSLEIDKENRILMSKIAQIHKSSGCVDSFNPTPCGRSSEAWYKNQMIKEKEIEFENKLTYKTLMGVKSSYSKKELDKQFKLNQKMIKQTSKYPQFKSEKGSYDAVIERQPSITWRVPKTTLENSEPILRPICFMDFQVEGGPYLGKIFIELYHDFVPVTCENFMEICRGESTLSYIGNRVHRIVKDKFIEAGDITQNNGRGGYSIYGERFPEENHILKHSRAGVISMKRMPNSSDNNSQFIITMTEMEKWDKMHVVFGRIVEGNSVIKDISGYGHIIGKPLANVFISDCGIIDNSEDS